MPCSSASPARRSPRIEITDYLIRVVQPTPAGRRGRADGRDSRRPDLLAARLARSQEARGLWDDGERCGDGLGEQRLRFRGRQHQGSDDPDHADLDHQPAFPRRIPQSRRQIGERGECAIERCRAGDLGRGQLRRGRGGRWAHRRLHRHPGRARRESYWPSSGACAIFSPTFTHSSRAVSRGTSCTTPPTS